jgi:hypothetical protein
MKQLKELGMMDDAALHEEGSPYYNNPGEYGIHALDYFICETCKHPFFGGKHECAQAMQVFTIFYFFYSLTHHPLCIPTGRFCC